MVFYRNGVVKRKLNTYLSWRIVVYTKVILLDNYEASTSHFPLKWKESVLTTDGLGDAFQSNRPKLNIQRYEESTGIQIDAVSRWMHNDGMTDAATRHTDSILDTYFIRSFESEDQRVELYLKP